MDKEKQIEKIAKEICSACLSDGEFCYMKKPCAIAKRQAERLYNAGCIVCLKEDWKDNHDLAVMYGKKEGRKEFYDKFNENIGYFKIENKSEDYKGYVQAIADICGKLDETAIELRVKIKE